MSRGRLLWRAVIAVLLTAIFSAFLFDLFLAEYFGAIYLPLFMFTWLVGSAAAMLPASVVGILVEWPKSILLARRSGGWLLCSLLVSMAAGVAAMFGHEFVITVLIPPTLAFRTVGDAVIAVVVPGLIGGACSAVFWWLLVIAPMRSRSR